MRTAQELVDSIPGMTLENANSIRIAQRKAHAATVIRFYEIIQSVTKEYIGIWGVWEERHGKVMIEVYDRYRQLFEDAIKQTGLYSTSGRYYVDSRLHSPMRIYYVIVPMNEIPIVQPAEK